MSSTLPELAGYPIVVRWPVQWGDQDAFGHVNNTVYFRWLETARIEYGVRIGLADMHAREKIGPILAAIKCDYRLPVTYPDHVWIGAKITRLGRTSFQMVHVITSEAAGRVVAEGDSTIVVMDYNAGKPCPIPPAIREAIERLEGRSL